MQLYECGVITHILWSIYLKYITLLNRSNILKMLFNKFLSVKIKCYSAVIPVHSRFKSKINKRVNQ